MGSLDIVISLMCILYISIGPLGICVLDSLQMILQETTMQWGVLFMWYKSNQLQIEGHLNHVLKDSIFICLVYIQTSHSHSVFIKQLYFLSIASCRKCYF